MRVLANNQLRKNSLAFYYILHFLLYFILVMLKYVSCWWSLSENTVYLKKTHKLSLKMHPNRDWQAWEWKSSYSWWQKR